MIQAWGRRLQQQGLAETYRRTLFANVSGVFPATYTHLMPSSSERTRRAVDGVFQLVDPEQAEGPEPVPEGEDSGPPTAW